MSRRNGYADPTPSRAVSNVERQARVLKFLRENAAADVRTVSRALRIPRAVVTADLVALVQKGRIAVAGGASD